MMFSGMTFCLIIYMVLPNGLDIRPTAEALSLIHIYGVQGSFYVTGSGLRFFTAPER